MGSRVLSCVLVSSSTFSFRAELIGHAAMDLNLVSWKGEEAAYLYSGRLVVVRGGFEKNQSSHQMARM